MDMKLTGVAVSLIETAYCLQTHDLRKDSQRSYDYDDYDLWFDQDFEYLLRYSLEALLQDIESDITSDWSTNESEQLSAQISAQMSADAEAMGMTTNSVTTATDSMDSMVSSDDSNMLFATSAEIISWIG